MTPGDLFRMSIGSLSAHKIRTRLTVAAVAIGVASVLLLTALGDSARSYVMNQFAGIGSNLLIVIPGKIETTGGPPMTPGGTQPLTIDDAESLVRQLPRITGVAPVSVGITLAQHGSLSRSVMLLGTTPDFLRIRSIELSAGSNLPDVDPRTPRQVCLIGSKLRTELFGTDNPLGRKVRLGDFRFVVIGVLAETGTSLGSDVDEMVIVPVANGQKMLNREGLFRIILEVNNVEQIERAQENVKRLLIDRHDDKEDFTLITQESVMSGLNEILTMLTMALAAIAAISLAVAGIGIMNVMLISVAERTGEVGLMKAIGASNGHVMQIFLAEATLLSLFGGLIGIAIGILGGELVHAALPDFPVTVPFWAIQSAIAVAIGVGIIFGVVPAWKASRLPPVDALRRGM